MAIKTINLLGYHMKICSTRNLLLSLNLFTKWGILYLVNKQIQIDKSSVT